MSASNNLSKEKWTHEVSNMAIKGAIKQLAANCFFHEIKNNILYLKINKKNEHQMIGRAVEGLQSYLIKNYDGFSKVVIREETEEGMTLAKEVKSKNTEQLIMNESRANSDPVVQEFVDIFDATIEKSK